MFDQRGTDGRKNERERTDNWGLILLFSLSSPLLSLVALVLRVLPLRARDSTFSRASVPTLHSTSGEEGERARGAGGEPLRRFDAQPSVRSPQSVSLSRPPDADLSVRAHTTMSTAISVFNYEFQGQVLSPAFSPPPSPVSDSNDSLEGDEDVPAVTTQRPSKRRMPQQQQQQQQQPKRRTFVNKKPKFPTRYHESLQPLSPCTMLPVKISRAADAPQKSGVDAERQKEFQKLMRNCDAEEVEVFLRAYSENIDINKFSEEGETALHTACHEGNVSCAEVLLRFGANPRITTRNGFSIVHLASFSGSTETLTLAINLNQKQ